MTLRALLVDDEFPARKELRFLLQPYKDIQIVGEAANALEAMELITRLDYSVIFLDIEMPGLDGMELARKLREKPSAPAIIFTTAYEQYAFDAFSVNALDYLLKPIHPKRLDEALAKLRLRESQKEWNSSLKVNKSEPEPIRKPLDVIPVETRGKTLLLRPEEVVYIYTDKENVYVKTEKEAYLTRFTLRELEQRLNPEMFFRSHRSYMVNIQKMRELIPYFNGTYTVVVDDKERSEVPVSRSQARILKGILGL